MNELTRKIEALRHELGKVKADLRDISPKASSYINHQRKAQQLFDQIRELEEKRDSTSRYKASYEVAVIGTSGILPLEPQSV